MTLDNAICDFEKMMKHQENTAAYNIKHGETEYAKMAKANKKKASEYRQIAEWLKELKAHREAWKKIFDEMMDVSIPGQDAEYVYEKIYDIIKKYRPKEGDVE